MSVAKARGAKGKADVIFGQLVRSRGACQICGSSQNLQTAHIHGRRYNAVRVDPLNAWCLCAHHHERVDTHADEKLDLASKTIGLETYYELKRRAEAGVKVSEAFWVERCLELQLLLNAQGAA